MIEQTRKELGKSRKKVLDQFKKQRKHLIDKFNIEELADKVLRAQAKEVAFVSALDNYFDTLEELLTVSSILSEEINLTEPEKTLLMMHKLILLHSIGGKLAICETDDEGFKKYCSDLEGISREISNCIMNFAEQKGFLVPMTEEQKNTYN